MRIDALEALVIDNHSNSLIEKIRELFIHRSDAYGEQNRNGRYISVKEPLDNRILTDHLSHRRTIGAYQVKEDMVIWGCLDLDPERFPDAVGVREACRALYDHCIERWDRTAVWIEASRHPDPSFHVWVFFESIPADVVKALLNRVVELAKIDPALVEVFPKQVQLTEDRPYGNFVKLPLGLHREVGKNSCWLDPTTFKPLPDDAILTATTAIVTPKQIQQIRRRIRSTATSFPTARQTILPSSINLDNLPCVRAFHDTPLPSGDRHKIAAKNLTLLYLEIMKNFDDFDAFAATLIEHQVDFTVKDVIDWQSFAEQKMKRVNCREFQGYLKRHLPDFSCASCAVRAYQHDDIASRKRTKEELKQQALVAEALGFFEDDTFVTTDDVEILYVYADGVYIPGKTIVKGKIEAVLGNDAKIGVCNEVIAHLKRRSYKPRSEFNRFEKEIPVLNGLLNLETMQPSDFTPEKIFTFKVNTIFDPTKKAPKFIKFLKDILPPEDERNLLQEWSGYTLLPAFPHHKFMTLVGTGRNGKGALIRTIKGILGQDNVSNIRLEHLDGSHRFMVANLFGKMMNVCSEPSTRKTFQTELLKQLTGQDTLDGEIKQKQRLFQFESFTKFTVQANKLPKVDDKTLSFWNRLLIIKFTKTFTDEQGNKIPDIEQQWLTDPDERSGILNWMIAGLKRLQEHGKFTKTKSMDQLILEYKQLSDPIGAFLADPAECIYSSTLWVTREHLYNAYKAYAETIGTPIEGTRMLYRGVREQPHVIDGDKKIRGKSKKIFKGIGLTPKTIKEDPPEPEDTKNQETIQTELGRNKGEKTEKVAHDAADAHIYPHVHRDRKEEHNGIGSVDIVTNTCVKRVKCNPDIDSLLTSRQCGDCAKIRNGCPHDTLRLYSRNNTRAATCPDYIPKKRGYNLGIQTPVHL